jgi:hypothetical protein
MANINDFKILKNKCRDYFDLLETELGRTLPDLSEEDKERFGFYLFMLESICNIRDIPEIIELICDQDFNKTVFGHKDPDFGLDAAYIDDEENFINLFNFKYRESFNVDKQQSLNETFLTTKFTNVIISRDTNKLTGKLKTVSDQIIQKLKGNEIWKLRLYVVSNESKEVDTNSPEIRQLSDLYDLEVIPMGLDRISSLMSLRPAPIDAVIHIGNDSILPFTESSLSSSKSYILRICANDLIRITCNNKSFREDYKMEDYSVLYDSEMDYNLLFDNVRGFVIKSTFNDNLLKTLKDEPNKFFMYNNGLTITANDIISEETNAKQKYKITIKDFQVVNGGQTLRTLHNFKQQDKDNIYKYLSSCELLIRVFKTSTESNIRNKIAEYTNSQNAISNIDLKALSAEQIQIEQYLDQHDIIYARKSGDTGLSTTKKYTHKISMEKFGQILFALQGFPEKVSNQKKHIFGKYYDTVFKEPKFDITKSVDYIKRYYEIRKEYESMGNIASTDQKVFFIMYIDQFLDAPIKDKISLLDTCLKNYEPEEDLADARKLLAVAFRQKLVDDINEYKNKRDKKKTN